MTDSVVLVTNIFLVVTDMLFRGDRYIDLVVTNIVNLAGDRYIFGRDLYILGRHRYTFFW